jgi:ATP-dependent Lhr-like helicase
VTDGQPPLVVLAATDPAQPYGLSLPWPKVESTRPQRVAGAWVVLVSGEAALYVEKGGRGLQALRPLDGTWESEAIAALVGFLLDGRRLSKLAVERVPEGLADILGQHGFTPTPKGLVRYAG